MSSTALPSVFSSLSHIEFAITLQIATCLLVWFLLISYIAYHVGRGIAHAVAQHFGYKGMAYLPTYRYGRHGLDQAVDPSKTYAHTRKLQRVDLAVDEPLVLDLTLDNVSNVSEKAA